MAEKEAKARIKINKLLEDAGWRFFDSKEGKANIILENNIKISEKILNEIGMDFERTRNGYIDFLLLDENGFPLIVLEAKSENKDPLIGKEQARRYALSQNSRFIILSNGSLHYFWDLERGNPKVIITFPSPETVKGYAKFKPNPGDLINEIIDTDYIALTQKHDYRSDPSYINEKTRIKYIEDNKLCFLRPYQIRAIKSIQEAVKHGKDRFLFEMATGTGKTLVAAAIIKLFLRTSNAKRVLFLVDRLELEDQADKSFKKYLKNDYTTNIYKENRDDWRKAEIVVSTVQSLLFNNKYKRLFSPDDFDLVISDEAHRSISGNSRSVFEYFTGYKLGLTATPKDYLKNLDPEKVRVDDPRELERRLLLDTYKTFGCENGIPTFRYSLIDGVKEGFLINPIVIDARTDITTQLLSDKGYSIIHGNTEDEEIYIERDFERKFFSQNTNRVFCRTFLKNALRDPISGEIGKTIIFCVSQNHAGKIVQILNEFAHQLFPGKYNSDFAIQVTSRIPDAKQFTNNFTYNTLSGSGNFDPEYKTCKTRICVTVGMMTTGYDCQDLLNLCLMRPVFSPTDFIQIKGRGTRTYNFTLELSNNERKNITGSVMKQNYKLFDFFANCEYFEEKYNYDQVLPLPIINELPVDKEGGSPREGFESSKIDFIIKLEHTPVGADGMRVDRMFFEKFEDTVKKDPAINEKVQKGDWKEALKYIEENIFDKPEEFFNLEKLRKTAHIDRRLSLQEIIEKIFGVIPYFKTKNELLDEEFDKFDSKYMPKEEYFSHAKNVFKSYITDPEFRDLIDNGNYALLNTNPNGESFQKLTPEFRKIIPEYIKDYVQLNQFL